jgi:hypothetical protein
MKSYISYVSQISYTYHTHLKSCEALSIKIHLVFGIN